MKNFFKYTFKGVFGIVNSILYLFQFCLLTFVFHTIKFSHISIFSIMDILIIVSSIIFMIKINYNGAKKEEIFNKEMKEMDEEFEPIIAQLPYGLRKIKDLPINHFKNPIGENKVLTLDQLSPGTKLSYNYNQIVNICNINPIATNFYYENNSKIIHTLPTFIFLNNINSHNCVIIFPKDNNYIEHTDEVTTKNPLTYEAGQPLLEYVDKLFQETKDELQKKWLHVFKNCVLPNHVKEIIEEAITAVLNSKKFEEWGINKHFEKGLANSILLYGPPGTGKTMICESIAAVIGKNLMKISNSELQSNIPGQTERNIKKSFEQATKNNAVIMMDECDSLLSDRDMVGMILGSEINSLLTEIERFDGVVVFTTNRLHRLDPALARRIIAKIELPLPEQEERILIWKNLIPPQMPIEENIDFEHLSYYKLSGGEIKNTILLAARKAICKNDNIVKMKHFEDSVKITLSSKSEFENKKPYVYMTD